MQLDTSNTKIIPIIIGGTGWLGTAAQHLCCQWPQLSEPIVFGSGNTIRYQNGGAIYPLTSFRAVLDNFSPNNNYIVFNFAYLTKDKASNLSEKEYETASLKINKHVSCLISLVKPLALLFISSGAASMVERGVATSRDLLIYGQQKIDDERFFGELCQRYGIKFLSPRLFSLGGPFINKLDAYALSNFILQSLRSKRILIAADRPVYRSYCHVFDLLNLAISEMTSNQGTESPSVFEVGGRQVVEMNDLAKIVAVATSLPSKNIKRRAFNQTLPPDRYVADNNIFEALLTKHSIPQTDLIEIVGKTLSFILDKHPNQIRPLNSH